MEGFEKVKLNPIQRLHHFMDGFHWLALTVIWCCDNDTGTATMQQYPFEDRWNCFISCVDTALRGYVWRLKRPCII